jgi:Tfp pilus assembly protein PilF
MAANIVGALKTRNLTATNVDLASPRANNQAKEAYAKGWFFLGQSSYEGFEKAVSFFQQAIRLDPTFAQAYAGLASAYIFGEAGYPETRSESGPKIKAAIEKALELDPMLSEAHTALAAYFEDYKFNWPDAEREYRLALRLSPGLALAHEWYGEFLAFMGRETEALAQEHRASEIQPLSLPVKLSYGRVLMCARRYDDAIAQLREALEFSPSLALGHFWLAQVYALKDMTAESVKESLIAADNADTPYLRVALALAYAHAGNRSDALRILRDLKNDKNLYSIKIAAVYAALNETDEALKMIQNGSGASDVNLQTLKAFPLFDPLRQDRRFQTVLKQINLSN